MQPFDVERPLFPGHDFQLCLPSVHNPREYPSSTLQHNLKCVHSRYIVTIVFGPLFATRVNRVTSQEEKQTITSQAQTLANM
jgi:hypothetical protein